MPKNALIKVKGTQQFMGKEIPVVLGGFGENCKAVTDKMVAEIHNMNVTDVRRRITDNIKRFKENIDFIDVLNCYASDAQQLLEQLGYSKMQIAKAEHIYLLSERGYAKLIKIMDTDLAWEIHDKLMDEYFRLREAEKNSQEQLTHVDKLVLKVYRGGSDAIIAHKELVKIEVAEETARLKDGNNRVLSAQQVVSQLQIDKLTTTLLHEWFSENGFGEMIKKGKSKRRKFKPNQRFFDYVAMQGYSYTGKTAKGDITYIYSTEMVDRLLERHMASIVKFVQIRRGVN